MMAMTTSNSINVKPLRFMALLSSHGTAEAHLDGPILWAEIPLKLLRELGVNGNGTNGIINQLLSVDTAKIAIIFTEKDHGKIDVGFRSRVGYDVSGIAARPGGGGHKQASGALIDGPLAAARERVLAEVKKSISQMVK